MPEDSHPPTEQRETFKGDFEHHNHHKHAYGPKSAKEDDTQNHEGKMKTYDDYLKEYKKGLKEYYGEHKELGAEGPPMEA